MGCFFSVHEALDGRKGLRRLEDTYFPCDKSSNLDKEERTSVEDLSNTRRFLKGFRSDESETMTTSRKDKRAQRTKLQKLQDHVKVMQKEVAGLRDRLQRTS